MAIIRRSGNYGVQIYRAGDRIWIGTYPTRALAKEAEREALAKAPTRGRETVQEFCDRYLDDFNYGGERWSTDSRRNLEYALSRLSDRFGSEKLARFPTSEALPWASRQPESVVRAARSLFNDAVRAELAPSNPFAGLRLERSKGRADIVALTEEELNLLAEVALEECRGFGETMRAFLLFQGYVGCRPKETFNLRWGDIDWTNSKVYVSPSKNGKARTIILPPQAAAALKRIPRSVRSEWIFTNRDGDRLTKTSITYWWNKVRGTFEGRLDPQRKIELQDARPRNTSLTLYELRHAAATIWLERGLEPRDVAKQLGHKDSSLVETLYGHPRESFWMNRARQAFLVDSHVSGLHDTAKEA